MKLSSDHLLQLLLESDFQAELAPKTTESPFSEIHLALGSQTLGKPMILQIGIQEGGATPQNDKEDAEIESLRLQFVNFFVMIPIEVGQDFSDPTHKFLNALNAMIELPGFGVLENFKTPYYRYTLLCQHNEIAEEMFLMVLGLVMHVLDSYLPVIQEVATGKTTLQQLSDHFNVK